MKTYIVSSATLVILEKLHKGFTMKQLFTEYNTGDNTVCDICKNKEKLIAFSSASVSSSGMKRHKTVKKSSYETLDNTMFV